MTALRDKQIWGAGIDAVVFDPPTKDKYKELWSLPSVVTTPHVGASTDQTQSESACAAVRDKCLGLLLSDEIAPSVLAVPNVKRTLVH